MKRMKCECGHYKTSHYDTLKTFRVGCHAVDKSGKSYGCKCFRSQYEVETDNMPILNDTKGEAR